MEESLTVLEFCNYFRVFLKIASGVETKQPHIPSKDMALKIMTSSLA